VNDEEMLEEQRRYYRLRAPEYDDWWQRRGRYDRGDTDAVQEWEREVSVVETALTSFDPRGDVLELAGGTGWWTERLARVAERLTVVDAAREAIALNRDRVGRADVDYVVADLFDWSPARTFDVVFFSFWLSHVPRTRFEAFWSLVRTCLSPAGRVFLIDNRADPATEHKVKDPYVVEYLPDLHLRELADGSQLHVVKVMYEPDELAALVDAEGWRTHLDATRRFIFGSAQQR
jgi:demethylmenaquinone methyltransferase/2-methoxy-6-polyprenyl-1,4-benzoquinol methylase